MVVLSAPRNSWSGSAGYIGHSSNTTVHGGGRTGWSGATGFYIVSSNYIGHSSNSDIHYPSSNLTSWLDGIYAPTGVTGVAWSGASGFYGFSSNTKGFYQDSSQALSKFYPSNLGNSISGAYLLLDGSNADQKISIDYGFEASSLSVGGANDGSKGLIYHKNDTNTYCGWTADNTFTFYSDGYNVAEFGAGQSISWIVNQDRQDGFFQVYGDNDDNLLVADCGDNNVGIGTQTPSYKLEVNGGIYGTSISGSVISGGIIHSQDISNSMALSSQISGMQVLSNLYPSKPTASNHMGEIIRVSGGANEKTWVFMSVKNDANSWEWIQLGMST